MGRGTHGSAAAPAAPRRIGARVLGALVARPTLSAALLFALVVLVYLWPVLLGGKVLSPDAVLYKVAPWQPFRPADVASYENYLPADVALEMRPWRELARRLLHDGVLPAWNPHALAGAPFLSNPQSGIFSVFSLPLWLLPYNYALGVTAALKLWTAAFGTYLLVRELRLGFLAGLLAGVASAFCAQNVMWLTPEIIPAVAVLLPWMLWLIERLFRGGGIGSACALGVAAAIALGGGHPGTQVHVLVAAGVYALVRTALAQEPDLRRRARPLVLSLAGLVLGVALMAPLMIPEILSSRGTVGTIARQGGEGSLPGLDQMPLGMARTTMFPDWWGRPSAFETTTSPVHTLNINYQERTFYAGAVALLLACAGLACRGAWRRQAPFVVLGALGLGLALHAPGLWWLASNLPPLDLIENQRAHFVWELSIAVLAGFGLQALLDRPRERGRQLAVALAGVGVGLLAAVTAGASAADAADVVEHFLTGRDFPRTGVVELTTVAWFLLFALGVTAALLALRRWPQRATAVAIALVLLATFDMLRFAHGYNPMAPADKVPPRATPAIEFLREHRSEGRFVAVELALAPESGTGFGIDDVRGYAPPYPTVRYLELWRMAAPEQIAWQPTTIGPISPAGVQVTGTLGARWILAEPRTATPPGNDPALRALRRVYDERDAVIFENPRATPRAFVAPQVDVVPDEAAVRAALVDSGFDARRAVVVESHQPGVASLTASRANGSAEIVEERNARVTLRATLDQRGIVVLGDQLTDGWSVRVDGREATPIRVDSVLRGVIAGPGTHEIVWSYRVPGLRAGALVSALALLVLAAGLLRARRYAASSKPSSPGSSSPSP